MSFQREPNNFKNADPGPTQPAGLKPNNFIMNADPGPFGQPRRRGYRGGLCPRNPNVWVIGCAIACFCAICVIPAIVAIVNHVVNNVSEARNSKLKHENPSQLP